MRRRVTTLGGAVLTAVPTVTGVALAPAAQAAPSTTKAFPGHVHQCVGQITGDGVEVRPGPGFNYPAIRVSQQRKHDQRLLGSQP